MSHLFKTAILLLATTLVFTAHAVDQAPPPDSEACANELDPVDLPPNWGFRPGEFLRMARKNPELNLAWIPRLARLIDDPASLPFFDYLGAYSGTGFTANEPPLTLDVSESDHRAIQIYFVMAGASKIGLLPPDPDMDHVWFLAEVLGPLPLQAPFTRDQVALVSADKVSDWATRARLTLPSLKTVALHSEMAQMSLVDAHVEQAIPKPDTGSTANALKARLRGERGPESVAETGVLDKMERLMDLNPKGGGGGPAKMKARADLAKAIIQLTNYSISRILNRGLISIQGMETEENKKPLRHPIIGLGQVEDVFVVDTFVDQGLTPMIRRAFVEIVLDKKTLRGRDVQQRARATLEPVLRTLRTLWRAFEKVEAAATLASSPTPPVRETREQRMREYQENVRVKIEVPGGKERRDLTLITDEKPRNGSAADSATEPTVPPSVWSNLLDERLTLNDARSAVERLLTPDVAHGLDLARSGFRYRVEFSPALIARLTTPAAGEPADPREWLEAMQWGPARANGQRGWKKRNIAVRGLYDWEVRLTKSPYAMLGFKRGDGVWRFEVIELTR